MATVRSRRIFGSTAIAAGATVTLYTVPAGVVAVLRSITIYNSAAAIQGVNLRITPSGGAAGVFWGVLVPATSSVAGPYTVLNPGDVLDAVNAGATGNVRVAGFGSLLDFP